MSNSVDAQVFQFGHILGLSDVKYAWVPKSAMETIEGKYEYTTDIVQKQKEVQINHPNP